MKNEEMEEKRRKKTSLTFNSFIHNSNINTSHSVIISTQIKFWHSVENEIWRIKKWRRREGRRQA